MFREATLARAPTIAKALGLSEGASNVPLAVPSPCAVAIQSHTPRPKAE